MMPLHEMTLQQIRIGSKFGEAYVTGFISVERSDSNGEDDFGLPPHDTLALSFDRDGYLDLHPVTDLHRQEDGLVYATDLAPRLRLWSVTLDTLTELPPYSDTPFFTTAVTTGMLWNRFCRVWNPLKPPVNPPAPGRLRRAFEGWGPREPGSLAQAVNSLQVAGGRQADGVCVLLLRGTLDEVWRSSLGTYEGPVPTPGQFCAMLSIPHHLMFAKGWRGVLQTPLVDRLAAPGRLGPR